MPGPTAPATTLQAPTAAHDAKPFFGWTVALAPGVARVGRQPIWVRQRGRTLILISVTERHHPRAWRHLVTGRLASFPQLHRLPEHGQACVLARRSAGQQSHGRALGQLGQRLSGSLPGGDILRLLASDSLTCRGPGASQISDFNHTCMRHSKRLPGLHGGLALPTAPHRGRRARRRRTGCP